MLYLQYLIGRKNSIYFQMKEVKSPAQITQLVSGRIVHSSDEAGGLDQAEIALIAKA